ncbi:aromatic ring-hydroxylating oxygenase subunit alpha [Kineococcus rhizosphaerae]|uniref:Rieske 2Fe-2S family protein n=1 Tax=Kineococcus rhizosphaerae TaxID=559628 RepID=A0A2T0R6B9_9ACTN|nr:aromatic ring-hydroxylating dioxygenase subunit alpha [Kineococcus rhizosphaerae]PRY16702.1 Rieske 2Fe-2S family protein [Kineococcus rhizosphaerae]
MTAQTAVPAPAAHEVVDDLVRGRVAGQSLEAPFYTSEEVYRRDLDVIFARNWIFVAAAAEIPEPGDYVTVDVGEYSVIVVRDDDEQVRAFHNVCRHRGSRLLPERQGAVGNIVCPYHRWTYGVDGRLRFAESQPATFDTTCFSLRPVHVRDLAGLVFICLAEQAPQDFDAVAEVLEPHLRPYELGKAKVAATYDLAEAGNWKLVMENNRECYHCDGHPELITAYFPLFAYEAEDITPRLKPLYDRYVKAAEALEKIRAAHGLPLTDHRELDTRVVGFQLSHLPLDGEGKSFAPNGGAVCRTLMGQVQDAAFGDLSLHLQPNSWFHLLSDHAVVFSVLPTSTGTSTLRTTWLVHPAAVEGVDYDLDALTAVWRATNDQDRALVAGTQAGCSDPGYVPGPYSMVEDDVEAFVNWYVTRLREAIA